MHSRPVPSPPYPTPPSTFPYDRSASQYHPPPPHVPCACTCACYVRFSEWSGKGEVTRGHIGPHALVGGKARHPGVGELKVGDGDNGAHGRRHLVRLGVRIKVRDQTSLTLTLTLTRAQTLFEPRTQPEPSSPSPNPTTGTTGGVASRSRSLKPVPTLNVLPFLSRQCNAPRRPACLPLPGQG